VQDSHYFSIKIKCGKSMKRSLRFFSLLFLAVSPLAQSQTGSGLPECNVSTVCTATGEGVFESDHERAELYLNGKVETLHLQSERILKKPHKDFVLKGQMEERVWLGKEIRVVESSLVIKQTCVELNTKTKKYEDVDHGCGITYEVVLKIEQGGKSTTVKGRRYDGA
jgi:hypothetical protein